MKIPPHAALTMVGVPAELRHTVTYADRQSVAPTKARAMTARAGLRRGDRDTGIEIEFLAERRLVGGVRVFLWERDLRRTPVFCLHRANGYGGFRAGFGATRLSDNRSTKAKVRESDQAEDDRRYDRTGPGGTNEFGCRHVWSLKRAWEMPRPRDKDCLITAP
jgi:hypothetical protein